MFDILNRYDYANRSNHRKDVVPHLYPLADCGALNPRGGGALAGIRRLLDAAKVQQIFKKTIIMEDLFTRKQIENAVMLAGALYAYE